MTDRRQVDWLDRPDGMAHAFTQGAAVSLCCRMPRGEGLKINADKGKRCHQCIHLADRGGSNADG